MPTLNEARNLPHVLPRIPMDVELVIVDGGSIDDTVAVARMHRADARVLTQSRRGKGNALACGVAACHGDIVVLLDADGSTDPAEIPRFIEALCNGADLVKGSRFLPGGGSADLTPLRRAGNCALMFVANRVFTTHYTDLCYGYNAFWRKFADEVLPIPPNGDTPCWGDGFEVETLIHLRAAKAGLKVAEVPSFEFNRIAGESKLHTVRDGWRVLSTVRREASTAGNRRPRRVAPRPGKVIVVPQRSGESVHGVVAEELVP